MKKILLATKNKNKVLELERLFINTNIKVLSLNDVDIPDVIEDQDSFEGNALKKAHEIYINTGMLSLADDSGLEVDYLNGAPGIYSARFYSENASHEENNRKLLELMKNVPYEKRNARFRCSLALVGENIKKITNGVAEGYILTEYKGNNGFGYDPLFFYTKLNKTFAEMTKEEKNKVSHRALAFKEMIAYIINNLH
ncbi:MAG: RdgB/HAM1 family non-canonical purine NTP pyrophosphatase [Candidatus Sericytochromatia bacterium]